jgi:hypothetical protein
VTDLPLAPAVAITQSRSANVTASTSTLLALVHVFPPFEPPAPRLIWLQGTIRLPGELEKASSKDPPPLFQLMMLQQPFEGMHVPLWGSRVYLSVQGVLLTTLPQIQHGRPMPAILVSRQVVADVNALKMLMSRSNEAMSFAILIRRLIRSVNK